jgi:hypothetical protein
MANPNYNGWWWDEVNSRLYINVQGTGILYFDANGLTLTGSLGIVVPGTTTLGTGAIAYTWPATAGTNTHDLNTDGSGTLSWAA